MGCGNSKVEDNYRRSFRSSEIPEHISLISKSIAKIDISNKIYSGFLAKFFKEDKDFFCLIIAGESCFQGMIDKNEDISFFYDNESILRKINLNNKERYIKNFKDIGINSIVIEILPSDEIEKNYFLLPMINYINEFEELKNEEIEIINYPKGKLSYSTGKINQIIDKEFIHSAEVDSNSKGLPIFLKDSKKVIGIQKDGKKGDFIGPIFNFFKSGKDKIEITRSKTQNENKKKDKETKNYINEANYKNGKKESNGQIKYKNGNYYIGEEKNLKRHGKGIEYYKNGEIKYDGNWSDDLPEGNGKFFEDNGDYFIG